MNGDFSRWRAPNARNRGYAGVLMQQGRLQTDSDWNENLSILSDLSESALAAVIGLAGTPKKAPGFAISAGAGGFAIGAGSFWINGLRVENPAATSYDAQGAPGLPPFTDAVAEGAEALIYLEARKEHVTGQEDPLLNDPALGGVDTATRIRAFWRVGVVTSPLTAAERAALVADPGCAPLPALAGFAVSTGRMIAGTAPAAALPDDSDCLIPPEAGYLSQENQLYRVQIIQGGTRTQARFVWSRENASVQAVLALNTDGEFILRGAREDEALGFVSGGWVEVFDDRSIALGRAGTFTRITLTDGVASFAPGIGNFAQMVNPRVRRWDHGGVSVAGLELPLVPVTLERGVQVAFTEGTYRTGDHWVFEARAATGKVTWPPYPGIAAEPVPPMGWGPHFAMLALARRTGNGLTGIIDLRPQFPALTCIQAEDVHFDDSTCQMGATTVQEALENLCARSGGLCTATVSTKAQLLAAVAALSPGQSLRLCLRGATFALDETLVFAGLGHVTVEGTGPQTVISVADGEAALRFEDCASVLVKDLSVNGGPTGTDGPRNGRLGALTMVDCGEVAVERVRAKCRSGADRATACIATRGRAGKTAVRIRDCHLRVGQAQIGIQIIDAGRVRVENNVIIPQGVAGEEKVIRRIRADQVQIARIARGLAWFGDPTSSYGEVLVAETADQARNSGGTPQSTASLRIDGNTANFTLQNERGAATAILHPAVSARLPATIAGNQMNHIATEVEMRNHVRNVMEEALRNNGSAVIGRARIQVFSTKLVIVADRPFLAQGITVAGAAVEEVQILGNRIDNANDGIRIAASTGNDPVPPAWRDQPPANRVTRAVVNGNTITVTPLSSVSTAYGIAVGHVERMTASQNTITGAMVEPSERFTMPHFGMHQFGWRGRHLTWTENSVEGLFHGYVVMPQIGDFSSSGVLWRLRDNSDWNTTRPYVFAPEVQVY